MHCSFNTGLLTPLLWGKIWYAECNCHGVNNNFIQNHNPRQLGLKSNCTRLSLKPYASSQGERECPQKTRVAVRKSVLDELHCSYCAPPCICRPSGWMNSCVGYETWPAVWEFRGDNISVDLVCLVCVWKRCFYAINKLSKSGWLRPHAMYMGIRSDEATYWGPDIPFYCGLLGVNPIIF